MQIPDFTQMNVDFASRTLLPQSWASGDVHSSLMITLTMGLQLCLVRVKIMLWQLQQQRLPIPAVSTYNILKTD